MNPETAKGGEVHFQDVPMAAPPAYPGPPVGAQPIATQPVAVTVVRQVPMLQATVPVTSVAVPVIVSQPMGNQPSRIVCRTCNQEMTTRVETNPTLKTHLFALLLCGLGCWCCVCFPYCMDSCMQTNHYCTTCGAYIGSYNQN